MICRNSGGGRPAPPGTAALLSVWLTCALEVAVSFGGVPPSPAAVPTRLLLFNLNPTAPYTITKNATVISNVNASQVGVVSVADVAAAGDRYEIAQSGVPASPPAAPEGVTAAGDDGGCATVGWNANPEPDVDYYRLYRGLQPGTYVDSLDTPDWRGVAWCGLVDGVHYFAVRAHNAAGLLSALSQEVSASVSNGSTQPPPPPAFVEAREGNPGCMVVSWNPVGSPDVVGYVVDFGTRSVAGGEATTYDHTEDVADAVTHTICDLADRTYYVAVRSRDFAGTLSAFSIEDTVVIVPSAVSITAFSATAGVDGVMLSWRVWTDENLRGMRLYRSQTAGVGTALNRGRLIDPSLSSWLDDTVEPATTYWYTLAVIGENGTEHRSAARRVTSAAGALRLEQNVPNPFNPSTSISYVVPESATASLTVYDVTGARVRRLVDGVVAAGRHHVHWDGRNEGGESVRSGTYFYRLTVGKRSITRKMLLLK